MLPPWETPPPQNARPQQRDNNDTEQATVGHDYEVNLFTSWIGLQCTREWFGTRAKTVVALATDSGPSSRHQPRPAGVDDITVINL